MKEVYVLYCQGEVWDIFSTFEKANKVARNLIIETYDDYDDAEILHILEVFNESRNHPCGCYDSFGEIVAKLDDIIISKYPVDPE